MKVELIPVIDIEYHCEEVKLPKNGPYWKYPNEWQTYLSTIYKHYGFKDDFIPFSAGSGLYQPNTITDANLINLIELHMEKYKKGETEEENIIPLYGGYVLNINNKNELFPQCCSDLSDWAYWDAIVNKGKDVHYNGHPSPEIQIKKNKIFFHCKNEYENFVPETKEIIEVDKIALHTAYIQMINELFVFAKRISKLSKMFSFKVSSNSIENLLIFRNVELNKMNPILDNS